MNCPKCQSEKVTLKVVESFDGAHEDDHYRCEECGYDWWIDGIDY